MSLGPKVSWARGVIALALFCGTGIAACDREVRSTHVVPASARAVRRLRASGLFPGPGEPTSALVAPGLATAQTVNGYEENAYALSEGKRLFASYNCVGCHSNGGGGMGPPLMDTEWIYGSRPADIYSTIVQGRPNGMPAFGGRIPEFQVWQLAAYVRSMSGLVRFDAAPARNDDMKANPPENTMNPHRPIVGPADSEKVGR